MTLAITTTTSEGIILAADSRQSYRNQKGMSRIGSDNASKLFQLNKRIGVATAGLAFLIENNIPKNISKFIEEFKRDSSIENLNVGEVTERLNEFFNQKYNWHEQLDRLEENIRREFQQRGCEIVELNREQFIIKFRYKDPQGNLKDSIMALDRIEFLIAGYNNDGSHEVYICTIPGNIQKVRDSNERGKEYGSSWIGQKDVVARVILGFEDRIFGLPFVQATINSMGLDNVRNQLRNLEYLINWGTMTLQDAIDFCTLIIQTTSAIQRFSDGILDDPGDMPGVGGPIDIAVITRDKGFVWISKKKLKVGDTEVDLDRV